MKKLTLSLVAAGLAVSSLGAYAALPTEAAPFQVVVPNLKSGLELSLEGLYLQPTSSDLSFLATPFTNPDAPAHTLRYLSPKYHFGFGVGLGYIFPDSGNDVRLTWTHTNFDDTADAAVTEVVDDSQTGADHITQTANVGFRYDAVDLELGQFVSVGTRLQTRVFVGLRGAELKMDRTETYSLAEEGSIIFPDPVEQTLSFSHSKFIGIGPRIGIDANYHVGDCFGIVSHFSTALLVGNVDTTVADPDFSINPNTELETAVSDTQTRIVPAFDAKLGLNYTILFNKRAAFSDTRLSIEAGYQVTQYFDAFDRLTLSDQPVPLAKSGDGSSNAVTVTTSNFGFHGPYLSLNLKI